MVHGIASIASMTRSGPPSLTKRRNGQVPAIGRGRCWSGAFQNTEARLFEATAADGLSRSPLRTLADSPCLRGSDPSPTGSITTASSHPRLRPGGVMDVCESAGHLRRQPGRLPPVRPPRGTQAVLPYTRLPRHRLHGLRHARLRPPDRRVQRVHHLRRLGLAVQGLRLRPAPVPARAVPTDAPAVLLRCRMAIPAFSGSLPVGSQQLIARQPFAGRMHHGGFRISTR